MLPLILTKPKRVLLIGGGGATLIKLKVLSKSENDISCYALEFREEIDNYRVKKVERDFYEMKLEEFESFDLIYIGLPYPRDSVKEQFLLNIVSNLQKSKLINVLSKPELSNFIHPCTRQKDNILVSVSSGKPKVSCALAEKFVSEIE